MLRDKDDEKKGAFWAKIFDLHRIVINKAQFADVLRKTADTVNAQRVRGQFLVEFDLGAIFKNIE